MAVERDDILFRRALRRERLFRDRSNPLDYLSDEELYQKYRFTREGMYFLCDLLQLDVRRPTNRSKAVPGPLVVCTALRYFSTGCFQRVVGDCMDIQLSQSTVSNCIRTVARALSSHCDTYVKFPSTGPEILRNQQEFFGFRNIPNIVGLIDCTHVKIIRPKENEDIFVNRHGYHSVNVQMICDSSSKITKICCRWPGSTHDSTILRNSNVWDYFENGNNGPQNKGLLLGDGGYPCKNWLLTPYRNPGNIQQERFNRYV